MKGVVYWVIGILIVGGLGFFITGENSEDLASADEKPNELPLDADPAPMPDPGNRGVDFQNYNIDYMNDNVKGILVRQAGGTGRTAFYLPSTGYVNVSRGSKFGVAWLMQNVNPNVPDGNYFEFEFGPNVESLVDCGVTEEVAQGWIERGWSSSGMISGQWREDWNEWFDAMTVYFSFPSDLESCSVRYDFDLRRDGVDYDSRTLEFNLV